MNHDLDLLGSRDVIANETIRFPIGHFHFLLVVLWNQASISVSEIFNGECDAMIDKLKRPLKEGQGHSFWYQSNPHIRIPIDCQYICYVTDRLMTDGPA